MRILVTAASKHGSTDEIASTIGEELERRGFDVTVAPVEHVRSIEGYDAVVLGSGVYMGRWLKPAKAFADREAARLASVPVWLFSSGPIGAAASKSEEPADRRTGDEIAAAIGAREHRLFAGRLDRKRLNAMERMAVRMVKAEDGDYRPWDEIRAWAGGIGETLRPARAG